MSSRLVVRGFVGIGGEGWRGTEEGRDGEEQRRGGEIYSCGGGAGMLLTTISGLHKLLSRC